MTNYKEVQSNWFKANKIGDFLEGTLISKGLMDTVSLKTGEPTQQMVYEVLVDEAMWHNLVKKGGLVDEENPVILEKGDYAKFAKASLNDAMKKIKIGQKVKIIFHSETPSKDKAKFDFKLVKVYAGDMDQEYLQSQWNELPVNNENKEENISFD